jgi:CheY-like chemotaxis protein
MELGPKVLVAEDDRMTRRILQTTLENHPDLKPYAVRVILAADGEEALRLFTDERPDIVMADLFMPKLDGFALCRTIRDSPHGRRIPIVVTSAVWKQPAILDQLRNDLGVVFVSKPFQMDELVAAAKSAIVEAQHTPPV